MNKSRITIPIAAIFALSVIISCKEPSAGSPVTKSNESDTTNYLLKGKAIATETQKLLAKNLTEAITKGGTGYAIQFCNIQALPLTDSMSKQLNASIKRVSDLPRNTNNNANEKELAYIQAIKSAIEKGETANPQIAASDNEVTGYYPIITNSLCLQCHGNKSTDITKESQNKIASLYPTDKATGYSINQLRGIWVVTMKKTTTK
jgi:Protein of unknown function (DUF3365)